MIEAGGASKREANGKLALIYYLRGRTALYLVSPIIKFKYMSKPLTTKEVIQNLMQAKATKVKLAVVDADGILRGKVISYDKFLSIAEKGFGFCDVIFGWDAADVAYDNASVTGWHSGYPDGKASVDIAIVQAGALGK